MSQSPSQGMRSAPLGAVSPSEKPDQTDVGQHKASFLTYFGIPLLVPEAQAAVLGYEGMLRIEIRNTWPQGLGHFQLWEMLRCETAGGEESTAPVRGVSYHPVSCGFKVPIAKKAGM